MPKSPAPRALLSLAALAAAIVTTMAAPVAEAAALTRQPYLQSTDATRTLIAFRTDAACDSIVRYGPTGTEQSTEQPAGTRHLHRLENLTPATEYRYEIEACGEVLATGKRFRTASPPTGQSVHFSAVGDNGKGNAKQVEVANAILASRPELSLALGDNAYESGTEEEHQTNLFTPMAAMLSEVPLFGSPGNHEYVTDKAGPYLDNFHLPANNPAGTERYYSFDWGFVHFVSLDSMCGRGTESADCTAEAQTAWLEEDLASSAQPWKVVFFHHPPFSSGDHGNYPELQALWGPVFERHGVDLVLTGHDHNYERSHPLKGGQAVGPEEGGVTYLVVGSGGAGLREWPVSQPAWSAVRNNTDYGHLDVKVEGGTLSGRFVTPSGAVADEFALTKAVAPPPAAPPEPTPPPPAPAVTEPEITPPPGAATPLPPESLSGEDEAPPVGNAGGCSTGGGLLGPAAIGAWALLRRRRRGQ